MDYKKSQQLSREKTAPKPVKYLEDYDPKEMEKLAETDGEETLKRLPRKGSHYVMMGKTPTMVSRSQARRGKIRLRSKHERGKHFAGTDPIDTEDDAPRWKKRQTKGWKQLQLQYAGMDNRTRMEAKRKIREERLATQRELAKRLKEKENGRNS